MSIVEKRVKHAGGNRRPYRMRKRREEMDQIRHRIVLATVALHGSVGPANTTISAIAEKAGVQRATVYRHFADEDALFNACTRHWLAEHPWPRAQHWSVIADPLERLARGLRELYCYYETNKAMLFNSYRDFELMPGSVREFMRTQVRSLHAVLLEPWPVRANVRGTRLAAAISLGLDFRAWLSLVDAGLAREDAADLMAEMVASVALHCTSVSDSVAASAASG